MPINESLKFDVSWGGAIRASATSVLNDTSRPDYDYSLVATNTSDVAISEIDVTNYTLTSTVASVNEGSIVTFNLSTTKLDTGTSIPYVITGIALADVSLGSLSGTFITDSAGKASLSVAVVEDVSTEGPETMTLTLTGKGVSKAVTINDTSGFSAYDASWHSNASGTSPISNVNEGAVAYLVVNTMNVANGTVLSVTLNGTGVTVADFTSGLLTGTVTINNGIGSLACTPYADKLTEGNEVVTATVKLNTTTVTTSQLTINDTSVFPTFAVGWYSNSAGTVPISSVNEGATAYLVARTTNVTDNTGLGIQFSGTGIALADMSGSAATSTLSSAINIVNNIGYLAVPIIADTSTEGNETLITTVSYFGTQVVSLNLTINDTSIMVLSIDGTEIATENYASKTIRVIDGVNLYDYFVAKNGRVPYAGEIVNFTVNDNIAIVGPTSGWAVTMDPRWNAGQVVTIENHGYILGRGGNAENRYVTGSVYGADSTLPGGGVNNTSSIPLTIRNHSGAVIAGGGGYGGGAAVYGMRGAGGAPYGKGGINYSNGNVYEDDRYGNQRGDDAAFATGGAGGVYNSINYGGDGGAWGVAGSTARYDGTWIPGSTAGPVTSGNVTIVLS